MQVTACIMKEIVLGFIFWKLVKMLSKKGNIFTIDWIVRLIIMNEISNLLQQR